MHADNNLVPAIVSCVSDLRSLEKMLLRLRTQMPCSTELRGFACGKFPGWPLALSRPGAYLSQETPHLVLSARDK